MLQVVRVVRTMRTGVCVCSMYGYGCAGGTCVAKCEHAEGLRMVQMVRVVLVCGVWSMCYHVTAKQEKLCVSQQLSAPFSLCLHGTGGCAS